MKTLTTIFVVLLFSNAAVNETITNDERKFAVKYLTETQQYLENAIKGLSKEQLEFKATPESWSVAQCVEHIAMAESGIIGFIKQMQQQPADGSKRSEIKYTKEEDLISAVTDRSGKANAPEFLKPSGKFADTEAAFAAFNTERNETKKYIEETQDDLHNHLRLHPFFGMLDSYQWIILISAHTKRHTLQIEEVKSNENFPKK